LGHIALAPRYARYLANLLVDFAKHIEMIDNRRKTKCDSNTFEEKQMWLHRFMENSSPRFNADADSRPVGDLRLCPNDG
jgi:hypothetical protein